METQQASPAGAATSSAGRKAKAPPMINEIAAVGIGKFLTDASTNAESKAKIENILAQFNRVSIVYPQNTADVVHVPVPDYNGLEEASARARELADQDLEAVSGGELGIALFFGTIGIGVATSLGLTGVLAGGAAGVGAVAIGATIFASAVTIGVTLIAGATAAIGVGLASGLGAFDGQDVNIGHAS
ncbi:MAG: hypothetical protein OXU50_05585 [Gammaproteobacteria bacterium]|nr:hypothetical protein [Gammaproteobacteria bacterium]MDD9869346.1 hypothetical protein [Gammaproteobacteria bacterium]MDD9886094.1 hypothetical protein [Gammaproteobacteria bacterium]